MPWAAALTEHAPAIPPELLDVTGSPFLLVDEVVSFEPLSRLVVVDGGERVVGTAAAPVDTPSVGPGPAARMCCAQEVPARVRARRRPGRRGGLSQVDVDDGIVDGQTSAEQYELVQLRREKRRLEMNEVLRRAAAYFAHSSFPG